MSHKLSTSALPIQMVQSDSVSLRARYLINDQKYNTMIHPDIEIEDLVRNYPFAVKYLMEKGIKCIACGEPIWGTLAEAAVEKGFTEHDIRHFVSEMIEIADGKDHAEGTSGPAFRPEIL